MWFDRTALAAQLRALDKGPFVSMCNDLLVAVAGNHGIDRSCIITTERIDDRDGGIDARCVGAPQTVGQLIPTPNVAYQFKSGGNAKSARAIATEDIAAKQRVREALAAGHSFVYLAAWDKEAGGFEHDVAEAARNEGVDVQDDQVRFFGGVSLASLLQPYPGVLHRHLVHLPLMSLDDWQRERTMANRFVSDQPLDSRIALLQAAIRAPQSRIRLVGRAGDGKTRTVLEALARSDLSGTVVYARNPDELDNSTIHGLRHTQGIQCTLVVDEVDDVEHERLLRHFDSMPSGVRLVTIGVDAREIPDDRTPILLKVDGLGPDLLKQVMLTIAPGAPRDVIEDAARFCGRSPKLAMLIAERMQADPSLARGGRALRDPLVKRGLDEYLGIALTDPRWKALAVASLLEHVGWARELEDESEILFTAAGLDPSDARRLIQDAHERLGVAPRTRRFLYVSPTILADYLASLELGSWTRAKLAAFHEALTRPMRERFARRMHRIASSLENREAVEEVILGDQGPFRSLAEAEAGGMTGLLRYLSGPLRQSAAGALRRMIEEASVDELQDATRSRRDMVEALTELLWFEDTFETAARVLLRLAIAENESWANNATGTWVETFQMRLGRTEAPWRARVRVVREAAQDHDPRARVLAAKAVGAAVKHGQLSRSGVPPKDVEGAPEEAWQPRTWDEWGDAVVGCLHVLDGLIHDEESDVRSAAVEALAEGAMAAYVLPHVGPVWAEAVGTLTHAEYDVRAAVLSRAGWAIRRGEEERARLDEDEGKEKAELIDERLQVLRDVVGELSGTDFGFRFRAAIDRDPWRFALEDESGERSWKSTATSVAKEAIDDPQLLEAEWQWLLDHEGPQPEQIMQVLGEQDAERKLEVRIRALAREEQRAVRWSTLYDLGFASTAGGDAFVDERLNSLLAAGDQSELAIDLLVVSPPTESRIECLVSLIETGVIPPEQIGQLQYTPVVGALSPQQFQRIANTARGSSASAVALLLLLARLLYEKPQHADALVEPALDLLDAAAGQCGARHSDYQWAEIAKRYVETDPVRVAKVTLKWVEAQESSFLYGVDEILGRAIEASPDVQTFFAAVVAPWLDHDDLTGWWVSNVVPASLLLSLPVDWLVSWIRERPEVRARKVARVLGPPMGERVSELHHQLLLHYHDAYRIGDVFYTELISGGWTGSAAARTRGLIEQVKAWVDDERPAVREWCEQTLRSLTADLERDEMMDEEDEFRFG